jgi:hypothetical protein
VGLRRPRTRSLGCSVVSSPEGRAGRHPSSPPAPATPSSALRPVWPPNATRNDGASRRTVRRQGRAGAIRSGYRSAAGTLSTGSPPDGRRAPGNAADAAGQEQVAPELPKRTHDALDRPRPHDWPARRQVKDRARAAIAHPGAHAGSRQGALTRELEW